MTWFKLYLSDEAFKMIINDHFSDLSKVFVAFVKDLL